RTEHGTVRHRTARVCRGASAHGKASTICCAVHCAVGCSVTLKCTMPCGQNIRTRSAIGSRKGSRDHFFFPSIRATNPERGEPHHIYQRSRGPTGRVSQGEELSVRHEPRGVEGCTTPCESRHGKYRRMLTAVALEKEYSLVQEQNVGQSSASGA